MISVFLSYSHKDEDLRNEVEAALSPLRRQGLIDVWHDRRITAGSDFSTEIDANLKEANIILLLVSNYFINSDYAYGIEMTRALERHEQGSARIIPVILRPTDWHDLPFGKLLALPEDGKAITSFPDIHKALADISKGIRQVITEISPSETVDQPLIAPGAKSSSAVSEPRSSNLRVQRTFNDRDRDHFLDDSFRYISTFFDNSLRELSERNTGIETRFDQPGNSRFTATIYRDGEIISECTIWRGDQSTHTSGIAYSSQRTTASNSYNELLSIDDDGYVLFLTPQMMSFHRGDDDHNLSNQGAAEYLWEMLIERLQ